MPGVLTKETKFRYHKSGSLLGKMKEKLELTADLRVSSSEFDDRDEEGRRDSFRRGRLRRRKRDDGET